MAEAKVFEAKFWQGASALILARVLDENGNFVLAAAVSAVKYVVFGQSAGQTAQGDLTPTWHAPPKGTTENPDARWQNRTYAEGRAGFNFEAAIPAAAFAKRDFYRVDIDVRLTSGYSAPIVLEGPAVSRLGQTIT